MSDEEKGGIEAKEHTTIQLCLLKFFKRLQRRWLLVCS